MKKLSPQAVAAIGGMLIGLLFGMLTVIFDAGAAFFTLLMGAVGAFLGWVIYGVASGHLNIRRGLRAMRRR